MVGGGTDAEADPHCDQGPEHEIAVRRVVSAASVHGETSLLTTYWSEFTIVSR